MARQQRDLLEVLKLELQFIKNGGYHRLPSLSHKLVFEDSPTCLNFGDPAKHRPCSECALIQIVPAEFLNAKAPCRHIPLNTENETVDSLSRQGIPEELEAALTDWLMTAITKLEMESAFDETFGDCFDAGSFGQA